MGKNNNEYKLHNTTEFILDESEEFVGYTTIDNYIFNNKNIKGISIGLYALIWQYKNSSKHKVYMTSIENTGKFSRRDIQRAMLNLTMEGFIIKETIREAGKIKGIAYKIRRSPLQLTDEQKAAIYNESKVNREYTEKVYGKEYAEKLENLSKLCVPTDTTDCTNCAIANCAITNCTAKKENRVINKIDNKSIKDDDAKVAKQSSSSSKPINQELIEQLKTKWKQLCTKKFIVSEPNKIKLTALAEEYGMQEVIDALDNVPNSDYLTKTMTVKHFIDFFDKVAGGFYDKREQEEAPAAQTSAVSNKIANFNSLGENGREVNHDTVMQLDRLLQDYKLGYITKEEYENMRNVLMQQ